MKRIFKRLKLRIDIYLKRRNDERKLAEIVRRNDENTIYLVQTPVHSNIGDHAIAIGQKEFISKNFSDATIIEVRQDLINYFIKELSDFVLSKSIITVIGGGNFGNEYMYEEDLRRNIVKSFPNNKIIIFPQTIYYSNDIVGNEELKITQGIFKKHKNLVITAREKVSYQLMKDYFPNNKIILTPDIVLSLSRNFQQQRSYGLGVIRGDQESIMSENLKRIIKDKLIGSLDQVIYSDMHTDHFETIYTEERREYIFNKKINQFQGARIVVTDRLHGMVLSAITGTPCIAFSNYNQKVMGTYDWIKSLEYIRFVSTLDDFEIAYNELITLDKRCSYDPQMLENSFKPLIESFKSEK